MTVHRSLVAARVNQVISVAIQRAVAFNILEYRYTTLPLGRAGGGWQYSRSPVVGGADWEDDEVIEVPMPVPPPVSVPLPVAGFLGAGGVGGMVVVV